MYLTIHIKTEHVDMFWILQRKLYCYMEIAKTTLNLSKSINFEGWFLNQTLTHLHKGVFTTILLSSKFNDIFLRSKNRSTIKALTMFSVRSFSDQIPNYSSYQIENSFYEHSAKTSMSTTHSLHTHTLCKLLTFVNQIER